MLSSAKAKSLHSLTKSDRIRVARSVYTVNGLNFLSREKTKHRNSDLSLSDVRTRDAISFSPGTVLKLVTKSSSRLKFVNCT